MCAHLSLWSSCSLSLCLFEINASEIKRKHTLGYIKIYEWCVVYTYLFSSWLCIYSHLNPLCCTTDILTLESAETGRSAIFSPSKYSKGMRSKYFLSPLIGFPTSEDPGSICFSSDSHREKKKNQWRTVKFHFKTR